MFFYIFVNSTLFYRPKSKFFALLIVQFMNNHYIRCKNNAKFLISPTTLSIFLKKDDK